MEPHSDTHARRLENAVRFLTNVIDEMGAASLLLSVGTNYGPKFLAFGDLATITEMTEQQAGQLSASSAEPPDAANSNHPSMAP
jgi:hypothetical protein